jgi:hypothetical protein
MTVIYSIILGSILLTNFGQESNKNEASYNSKVKFELGKQIIFPDFIIEYTGKKTVPGPNNAKWIMTIFYFNLKNSEQTKQISWSSGTGDISPTFFEFNKVKFAIEMQYSEKIKVWLKQNEFVISKEQ